MKKLIKFGIWTTILMIALQACEKNDSSNSDSPDNPAAVMENVALSGAVKDTNGNPMSGVRITTGSLNATTGSDGTFSFKEAGTVDDRVIMKYEKSGYFTLTRSCEKDSSLYVEAVLYPQGNSSISLQTTFDASKEKTLQLGGVKIDFPASSIASADGKAYSGNVHVDALHLEFDGTNENFTLMMPGSDLICLASDNSKKMLTTLGMVNVVLTDNSGNPVKIKDGATATISFPAPAPDSGAQLPATVPLWTFDEAKGLWIEDGTLTLQDNVYTGTVSHFSWKSFALAHEFFKFFIHAQACGKPAEGAYFLAFIDRKHVMDYGSYLEGWVEAYSNSNGDCYLNLPLTDITGKGLYGSDEILEADIRGWYDGQELRKYPIDLFHPIYETQYFNFDQDCAGAITFNLIPGPDKQSFIVGCKPAMPKPPFGDRFDPLWFLTANQPSFIQNRTCPDAGPQSEYSLGITISSNVGWNADFTEFTYACQTIDGDKWTGTIYLNSINDACAKFISDVAPGTLVNSVIIGQNNPISLEFSGNEN